MALRIASRTRINGAACDHLRIVVEEGPMGGPADRSFTFAVPEDVFAEDSGMAILTPLVRALPVKGETKGCYLFSWALYQMNVKGLTPAQVVGVWID